MASATQFHPPAFLKDFTEENAKTWSTNYISPWVTSATERREVSQFYNAVTSDYDENPSPLSIDWRAFPANVRKTTNGPNAQFARADSTRAVQDEYCEWSVERRPDGKIVRVVFTCEGPEYWQALAELQPDTVVDLYNQHNPGLNITKEQLFFPDSSGKLVYKTDNEFNNSTTTGSIMHLIQRNNTLRAQINLGADATVRRINAQGQPVRDMDKLIRCSRFGGIYRNSDPNIGVRINNLAYENTLITVENPVGLYFDSVSFRHLEVPPGHNHNPNDFWNYTRGTAAHDNPTGHAYWVRGVFEVPADYGYVVGDLLDSRSGEKIQWGSQLADYIFIKITGWAIRAGLHPSETHHCREPPQQTSKLVPATYTSGGDSEGVCRYSGIEHEIEAVCL